MVIDIYQMQVDTVFLHLMDSENLDDMNIDNHHFVSQNQLMDHTEINIIDSTNINNEELQCHDLR